MNVRLRLEIITYYFIMNHIGTVQFTSEKKEIKMMARTTGAGDEWKMVLWFCLLKMQMHDTRFASASRLNSSAYNKIFPLHV